MSWVRMAAPFTLRRLLGWQKIISMFPQVMSSTEKVTSHSASYVSSPSLVFVLPLIRTKPALMLELAVFSLTISLRGSRWITTPFFMPGFILQVMDEIGEMAVFPDPVGLERLD